MYKDMNFSFILNVLLHGIILFIILLIFFKLVVSNIYTSSFNDNVSNLISDNINKQFINIDTETNGAFKKTLIENKEILEILQRQYGEPDEVSETNNKWMYYYSCMFIFSMIAFTISYIIVAKHYSNNLHAIDVIKENIITFVLIGLIEVIFFLKISENYNPIPPSLIVNTFYDGLKN